MPESTDGGERVNAFRIGDGYFVRHYFEEQAVFDHLRRFYDNQQYRFEIPADSFPDVRSFLLEYGYRLRHVSELEPFIVVVRKYTTHPDDVFTESVYMWDVGGYHCFLLCDRVAVDGATRRDATPLADVADESVVEFDYRRGATLGRA